MYFFFSVNVADWRNRSPLLAGCGYTAFVWSDI